MAALHDIEASCDAIIAKLNAELPAKIAALNAEIADEWQLLAPAGISFGPRAEIPYPWVVVRPAETTLLSDASGREHEEHRIDVIAWDQNASEEGLARLLIRWRRALREVVMHYRRPAASYTDGGGGYGLQLAGSDYGPFFQIADQAAFYSWVSSTFTVQQQQDLP